MQVRRLGRCDYEPVWQAMRSFTDGRGLDTRDELWVVEHPPVYTVGLNGRDRHLLGTGAIPVVHVDRGGQVTYHGPGQVVVYLLLDLQRRGLGIRKLVERIEDSLLDLLDGYGIAAERRSGAPGVYVAGAKIAALGLRVRRGRCYHGMSLNVDMDLGPFAGIDPCGYPGMAVTQLAALGGPRETNRVADHLVAALIRNLGCVLPARETTSLAAQARGAEQEPERQ